MNSIKMTKDEALTCFLDGCIFGREKHSCNISIWNNLMNVTYNGRTNTYDWIIGIKLK